MTTSDDAKVIGPSADERPVRVDTPLINFVRESNKIEGILRAPTQAEIAAHQEFLDEGPMTLEASSLQKFVAVVAPRKPLREKRGLDVRVGNYIAPPGGPRIADALLDILVDAAEGHVHPYEVHQRYEKLHPFMDGNGRSGRVLWLWMMRQRGEVSFALSLGFLHCWYYQSLSANPTPPDAGR